MSFLSYNTITLPLIRTEDVDYSDVMSDDGMDYLHTKISIGVRSMISPDLPIGIAGGVALPGESGTAALARVQHMLEQPRKLLIFGASPVQPLVNVGPQDDVRNGPFPRNLKVTEIQGTNTFQVSFRIEAHINQCPNAPSIKQPMISNRWRQTVTIDEDMLTRKTTTGKLIIRGGQNLNPDDFRFAVFPPIPVDFHRVQSEYIVQEDGLALLYTFADQELTVRPPVPAIKAEGEYVETIEGNGNRIGEFRLRLTGAKPSNPQFPNQRLDQAALLSVAIDAAVKRLDAAGLQRAGDKSDGGYMAHAVLRSNLVKNEVAIVIRGQLKPYIGRLKPDLGRRVPFNLLPFDKVYFDEGRSDASKRISPGFRGSAGLRLASALLNDPCLLQATLSTPGGSDSPLTSPGTLVSPGQSAAGIQTPSTGTLATPPPPEVQGRPDLPVINAALFTTVSLPDLDSFVGTLQNNSDPFVVGGIYSDYRVHQHFRRKKSTLVLPGGKLGVPCAFVKFADDVLELRVDWTAERIGEAPLLPSTDLLDNGNSVLLDEHTCPEEVVYEGADSTTPRVRVSGTYWYGFKDSTIVDTATAPVTPLSVAMSPGLVASLGSQDGTDPAFLDTTEIEQAADVAAGKFAPGIIRVGLLATAPTQTLPSA
jgi:hypothetical protein